MNCRQTPQVLIPIQGKNQPATLPKLQSSSRSQAYLTRQSRADRAQTRDSHLSPKLEHFVASGRSKRQIYELRLGE